MTMWSLEQSISKNIEHSSEIIRLGLKGSCLISRVESKEKISNVHQKVKANLT